MGTVSNYIKGLTIRGVDNLFIGMENFDIYCRPLRGVHSRLILLEFCFLRITLKQRVYGVTILVDPLN